MSLIEATKQGDTKRIWYRLQKGYDINEVDDNGQAALHHATDAATVDLLIRNGAYIDLLDDNGEAPIHTAARNNHAEVVDTLLECGDDIETESDPEGYTPLMIAARCGSAQVIELLVQRGANLHCRGRRGETLVYLAAGNSDEGILAYLYKAGCLVGMGDAKIGTPLHIAVYRDRVKSVKLLVGWYKAPVNERDHRGYTPLHLAATLGRWDAAKMLVESGADIEAMLPGDGARALHLAAKAKDEDIVRLLLDSGAHIDVTNNSRNTPLSGLMRQKGAVTDEFMATLTLLLSRGADPLVKDDEDRSAIDYAKKLGVTHIFESFTHGQKDGRGSEYGRGSGNMRDSSGAVMPTSTDPDAWFRDYQDVIAELQKRTPDTDKYQRVKVAIIDTGVVPKHGHMYAVAGYRDFVDGDHRHPVDKSLHGSAGLHLVASLAPEAEVYIARAFKSEFACEDTPDTVAKAIEYAVDVWKVDVITLASGFENDQPKMRQVIQRASDSGVLVFAAASNEGNRLGISFPARMTGRVMCMFACDGNSKTSTIGFNPAPAKYQHNFAFPGKDVQAMHGKPRLYGTSIATFVGAAIAAEILDFSRHSDIKNDIGDASVLKTVAGMSQVFDAMSEEEYGYKSVIPLRWMRCRCVKTAGGRCDKRSHFRSRLFTALNN
ncbi:hypothetical protein H072_7662 [Dactylellina haptotyla CBS 200.50]|uniref:Peptidase S8/S53 domain-containing protein n=1 Tax=Dactylellina haptotyla (strain CBS 200.50) TaxID=1284197 RepID=S8BH01_DACHA|nr:hypothetical protein H072_7662 [Dactylellina haptotyla CBS 200.50]